MIDIKILKLLSSEGFDEIFYEVSSKTPTYKKAY